MLINWHGSWRRFFFIYIFSIYGCIIVYVNVDLVLRGADGDSRGSKPRGKIHKEINTKSPYKIGSYRKK